MSKVAIFIEQKARGPKKQIFSAFRRFLRLSKQERSIAASKALAAAKGIEKLEDELNQLQQAIAKADQARILQEMQREYKAAIFYRDQVVFYSKKSHTLQSQLALIRAQQQEMESEEVALKRKKEYHHSRQQYLGYVDESIQRRELALRKKHEMEWNTLEAEIEKLKQALPPAPQCGVKKQAQQTCYSAETAQKLKMERSLANAQRYEAANMVRQQIDMAEVEAYDGLVAEHAAHVEMLSDQLSLQQVEEMNSFVGCVKRAEMLAPRLVRMAATSHEEAVENLENPPLIEETIEELLDPVMANSPMKSPRKRS